MMKVSKGWVLLNHLLMMIILCFELSRGANYYEGSESIQNLKKTSNERPVTIQVGTNDIYDCVVINQQPSLSHPLLKGHKIQMKPTSLPRANVKKTIENSGFHVDVTRTRCPSGTVPIQRTNTTFLRRHFALRNYTSNLINYNRYYTTRATRIGTYYGGKVSMSVHSLDGLSPTHQSAAILGLTDKRDSGSDQIGAGWIISSEDYLDTRPRLDSFWHTRAGGGCQNIRCPGFVQISRDISLGAPFSNVSKFQGTQIHMTVLIYNDPKTHNWWLLYGEHLQVVGYWPNALFTTLSESAVVVEAGGLGVSDHTEKGPPIGSGHYPNEGFGRAAYVKNIEIVDTSQEPPVFINAKRWFVESFKIESCYGVGNLHDDDRWGLSFFHGGPGGCDCRYDCYED